MSLPRILEDATIRACGTLEEQQRLSARLRAARACLLRAQADEMEGGQ